MTTTTTAAASTTRKNDEATTIIIVPASTTFRALTKAVGIWTLLYIGLALVLAIWKIQTPVLLQQPHHHHHHGTTTTSTNEGGGSSSELELLFHTRIHQLEMAIQQSQERNHILQQGILERQTFHQRVRHSKTNHPTDDDDESREQNNDAILQKLLAWYQTDHKEDESSRGGQPPPPVTTLSLELHSWTTRHDWSRIQTLWDAMNHHHYYRVMVDDTNETEHCRPTPPQWATHEQLHVRLQQLQTHEFLSSTTTTRPKLPLSWSSSRRDMQMFLQQTWNETIQSLRGSDGRVDLDDDDDDDSTLALRDENHGSNCLPSHDWLEEFINVGWDALHRDPGLDVRRDLLLAIRASSSTTWDVSNVRLDIPPFVTTYHGHAAAAAVNAGAKFDNLRQYLDRPCMYELSIYLDVLLDYISGRHEILDDFMDQYIYNNPHFTSSSSLRLPSRHFSTTLMGPRLVASLMNDVLGRLPMISLSSSSSSFANSTNWTDRLVSAIRSTMGNTATTTQ